LCFQSKERLPQDALLLLFVVLNMNGKSRQFVLQAMILKSERILSESDTYEHRAKFMNLAKEDREYIIQFIFEEERKQRQQERRIN
jgi:c-di-GMP-binding flagellar brake protein YcgR